MFVDFLFTAYSAACQASVNETLSLSKIALTLPAANWNGPVPLSLSTPAIIVAVGLELSLEAEDFLS